jgi:Flp pilus assembly protein TadG
MAAILVFLIPLLLGIFEFGMAFYAYNAVTDASREAARWASVRGSSWTTGCSTLTTKTDCNASSSDIQTFVQGMGYPVLSSSSISASTTWLKSTTSTPTSWSTCTGGCTNAPGNVIQVTVSYSLPLLINFYDAQNHFSPSRSTWNISSTATMVVAQ